MLPDPVLECQPPVQTGEAFACPEKLRTGVPATHDRRMRTRVKVCCIASPEEARLAIEAGADALGLVGRMPSGPGPLPEEAIAEIAALVPPPVATFLLTAETEADAIAGQLRRTGVNTVQVVTHIAPGEWERLAKAEPRVRRVQVVHVEGPEALEQVHAVSPYVDAILLDSGRPNAPVPELGGTGRCHNWAISARIVAACPRPVFLAGGLSASNTANAIRAVQPFGLDVCSGVRTGGKLDTRKLLAFMRTVRQADSLQAANEESRGCV